MLFKKKLFFFFFFVYFFGGLECVGHSFAYVTHLSAKRVFQKDRFNFFDSLVQLLYCRAGAFTGVSAAQGCSAVAKTTG